MAKTKILLNGSVLLKTDPFLLVCTAPPPIFMAQQAGIACWHLLLTIQEIAT
jgi:hypothetical protein